MADPITPESLAGIIADSLFRGGLLPDDQAKIDLAAGIIAEEIYARLAVGNYIPPIATHGKPGDTEFTHIEPR